MENIQTQNNLNLNKFFRDINLKKQYIQKLKNKIDLLNNIKKKNDKRLRLLSSNFSNYESFIKEEDFLITYIVDITFSRTNTLLSVMEFSGKLKFFCSAGSFKYKGKRKKSRYLIFRSFYKTLITKLKFLKGQPLALHLKNVGSAKFRILKLLKKKLFVKIVKSYGLYPHNGCRKKKIRRK